MTEVQESSIVPGSTVFVVRITEMMRQQPSVRFDEFGSVGPMEFYKGRFFTHQQSI